jgi:hypothetical protein
VFFILEQLWDRSSYYYPQDLILFFDSETSKTLSVCVGGGVLAVIKCIYLPPTYLHFIQDIEDRCLLLTNSTSFFDLQFQEHRMTEKDHMDQNPCISSICPKKGIVIENMTWGDDVAQSKGPTEPKWGRSAPPPWPAGQVLAPFQILLCQCVKEGRCTGHPMPKVGVAKKHDHPATLAGDRPNKWAPWALLSAKAPT